MDTPRAASALRPDREWIEFQQRKVFEDQLPIADVLDPLPPNASVDVLVVGAGPAGLAVAAQCASRGVLYLRARDPVNSSDYTLDRAPISAAESVFNLTN